MAKQFIRIGSLYLNVADIIEVDADCRDMTTPYVRVTTRAISASSFHGDTSSTSESHHYCFQHGTPEATAVLAWLEPQTEILL